MLDQTFFLYISSENSWTVGISGPTSALKNITVDFLKNSLRKDSAEAGGTGTICAVMYAGVVNLIKVLGF